MAEMAKRTCGVCDKTFEVSLCRVNAGGGKYCSVSCRQKGVKALRDRCKVSQDARDKYRAWQRRQGQVPRW